LTIFVIEDIKKPNRRRLFTLLDVDVYATPLAWLNPLLLLGGGLLLAFVLHPAARLGTRLVTGLRYGLLIFLTDVAHNLGHILSSRAVGAPMTAIIATATVPLAHYEDDQPQPSRVHVGRSLGGPVLNLLLGAIALATFAFALPNRFIRFFGIANLVLGGFSLLPLPSIDGGVIVRELRKLP
jgi:Zn-dependent protease